MGNLKGEPTKVRLYVGDNETLRELSKISGLEQMQLMQMILHAGLEAVKAARFRVLIPLTFVVDEGAAAKRAEQAALATEPAAPSSSRAAKAAAELTGASPSGKKPRFER